MKRITTALFFFLTLAIQAKSQTQTIRADKYMIVPRSGLGSAYRTKFITDQVFARHRFYIGSDTSNYQNEAFDVTVNARFGAKIKLGTTYGNAGDYIRSGGSLVNPTWSKIQWTDIEGVPSSSNSWVKIPINGTQNLGIGNTSTSPFVFGSGTTRVGEYNQYGELYGFTTLSINSGYTNLKNYGATGGGYAIAVGGKATFGYHTYMPDAMKTSGNYMLDVAKRYSSDAAQIRLATYNGSGGTNVPDWTIQSGANNVFSIQKAGSPWFNADTTSSMYINAGRFNFGRSTGLNNTKFTFGGSMTVLDNFIADNIFAKQFSLVPTTGSIVANQILTTDANGNGTWQENKAVKNLSFSSGSFSWDENGFSFAAPPLVTLSTAQSITGVKTFQQNTASYMGYFNNTNSAGKGVKFTNTGIFPAIEVWQDLGETPGVQLWSDGSGDFANYLRTKYFLMSNGAGANKILQSDVNGLGSWVANTSLPISTSTQTALDLKLNISTASTTYAPITQPTFITDATTPRLKITGAGDIGNGGALVMAGNSNDLTMHGTGKVILGTGGFQRLVVTNAGNVGIGTTAPVAKFEVSGLAGFRYNDGKQADGKYLRSNSTGVSMWDSVRHTDVMGLSSNYARLNAINEFQANRMRFVKQSSSLTENTLFGQQYFDIDQTASGTEINSNFGASGMPIIFNKVNGGNVGIGTFPSVKLDINGEIKNNGNAFFTHNGGVTQFGQGTGTATTGLEIGTNRSGTAISYIDLGGEATNSDYGLRVMRSGLNSSIFHAGLGGLDIGAINVADVNIITSNASRLKIFGNGNIAFRTSSDNGYNFNFNGTTSFTGGAVGVFNNNQIGIYSTNTARNIAFRRQINGEGDAKGMAFFGYDSTTYSLPLVLKDNGNVGVNTHNPLKGFHVKSNTSTVGDYQIIAEGMGGGYGAGISFQSLLAGTSTMKEMARITADGESAWNSTVSNQNASLRFQTTLSGATREVMKITANGMIVSQGDLSMNGNYPVISMAGSQSGSQNIRLHNYISGLSNAGFEIYDQTNTTSRMVISSTGNMGIGTNLPVAKLTVNGDISFTNNTSALTAGRKIIFNTAGGNYAVANGFGHVLYDYDTGGGRTDLRLGFRQNTTGITADMVTFAGNGNVGIGNTSPNAPLQFSNSVINRKIVIYDDYNNDHQFYGIGLNASTLRYQVQASTTNHVFFAGTSSTTSQQLLSINGDQTVTYTPLTTAQINALTKVKGKQAYNGDTDKPVWCNGTLWKYADGSNM